MKQEHQFAERNTQKQQVAIAITDDDSTKAHPLLELNVTSQNFFISNIAYRS